MGSHQRPFERYHTPDPPRPPLPQDSAIGGSQPLPKTSIAIIPGKSKATDFKFGQYIHRFHPNKSPLKISEKGGVGTSRDCPFFTAPLLSQERVKLRISNFVCTFTGSIGTKDV